MVTVFRTGGLTVVIFTDDHEPAHVHVFGDGHAKVNLLGVDGRPQLVWARGMTRAEVRRAVQAVVDQKDTFLVRWRDIHG